MFKSLGFFLFFYFEDSKLSTRLSNILNAPEISFDMNDSDNSDESRRLALRI